MRIMLNTDKFYKSIIMLKKLNWLNIKKKTKYLKEYITQNFEYYEHNTPFKNDFHLNNSSKLVVYKSIFYKELTEYNKLKDSIKNQRNLKRFKTAIKKIPIFKTISIV